MKCKQFIGLITLIILATAFYAWSTEDSISDDTAVVDNSVFEHPQRTAAVFDHDDHNEKAMLEDDCAICHHVYEGKQRVEDESSEDQMCSECHALKATDENSFPLRMAFHKRCKDCHFESAKGPVLCGECHIRK